MTPLKVIIWFMVLGVVFVIIGIVFMVVNNSVCYIHFISLKRDFLFQLLHIEHYYYGEDDDSTEFKVTLDDKADSPVYVYYTLSSFYQNHAKFVDGFLFLSLFPNSLSS